ncbi:MAG TPA: PIG-L family deacetylase [Chthoniobacteraceae bacterium]|nr:PIG-L family deacetylase [Chthoniobacteraceae bacterium]
MNQPVFTADKPARLLAIVPHQDDFEFNAGGTFARLRQRYGDAVRMKVIITSRGASGHHEMEPDALFMRRMEEARESAALIGAEAECLTQLDGTHVAAQVLVTRNLLGGIWNAIRDFQADYLFCPPVVSDPLAAVHVDHEETARAVRLVGYQLGVPRAYPALTATAADIHYRAPVIVLCDDVYSYEKEYHVACDIAETYGTKVAMAKCHRSQIYEWLPFNRRQAAPSEKEFETGFRLRHTHINERFGLDDSAPREYFRFSRWGRRPLDGDRAWLFGE